MASSISTAYEIRDCGRKGKGMVSVKDLRPGDVVVSETASIVVDENESDLVGPSIGDVYQQYLALSPALRDQIRGLTFHADDDWVSEDARKLEGADSRERDKLFAIFDVNCFASEDRKEAFLAVEVARINHSCAPNATYNIVSESGLITITVRALRRISKDEEITIPYVPATLLREERQKRLSKKWRFDCECEACGSAPLLKDKTMNELIKI